MQLSRIIQCLLYRDIVSYLVPGILAISPFALLEIPHPEQAAARSIVGLFGLFVAAVFLLALAYFVGYLISTVAYSWWRQAVKTWPPSPFPITDDLCRDLETLFGGLVARRLGETDRAYSNRLVEMCLNYVCRYDPDYYTSNIERYYAIKNFEIAGSGVLLIWAVFCSVQGYSIVAWCFAVFFLGLSLHLFCTESRKRDANIEEMAIMTFKRLRTDGQAAARS